MIEIAKYDLEGNFLETVKEENYNKLAKVLKVDASSLMNNLEGRVLSCENFQFRFLSTNNKPFTKLPEVWNQHGVTVRIFGKYYKDRLVSTYRAIEEAEQKNKVDKSAISRCLKGMYKSAGGYTWKYLN